MMDSYLKIVSSITKFGLGERLLYTQIYLKLEISEFSSRVVNMRSPGSSTTNMYLESNITGRAVESLCLIKSIIQPDYIKCHKKFYDNGHLTEK